MELSPWQFAKSLNKKIHLSAPAMFIHELVKNPGCIGAICPSSQKLARCMVSRIDTTQEGLVVELGAGTGVITQALLDHGVKPENLVVIEFADNFYLHLKERFPQLNIIHGDAAQLRDLLPANAQINTIVSSLPLISLPPPVRQAIVSQWQSLLCETGQVVQFTYNLKSTYWRKDIHTTHYEEEFVWANIPPAKVMRFRFHS